jgi:hypothetical protein
MSNLLKYAVVLAMILVGIMAFSLCAECPFDACGQVLCGGTEGSRPLARLAFKLTGAFLSVASTGLGLLSIASLRFGSAPASLARESVLLRASSLRI